MIILDELDEFTGKRNAVLTIILPPKCSIKKTLDGIQNRVSQIKHKNKRGQIMQVLKHIREQNQVNDQYDGMGYIICSGYNQKGESHYWGLQRWSIIMVINSIWKD
jgi:peptide subunit release factor 1 (eRF1)